MLPDGLPGGGELKNVLLCHRSIIN